MSYRICLCLTMLILAGCATPAPTVPTVASAAEADAAFKRRDYAVAYRYYRPLAERGDAHAQMSVGVMHDQGLGVTHDPAEGAKWFRLAAKQGHPTMQYSLGMKYAIGDGVPRDRARAYMWVYLAANAGNAGATKALPNVASGMTPQQIAEAQKAARDCQQTRYRACE